MPRVAPAAVAPSHTRLFAEQTLVTRVALTVSRDRVAAAVRQVAGAFPVTAGSPPARHALAHTRPLVTRRQIAVAFDRAFDAPESSVALAAAR